MAFIIVLCVQTLSGNTITILYFLSNAYYYNFLVLGDTMHTFLNENWKQIAAEFGRPLMESAAKTLFKNISNFFKHSPINEISESSD